MKQMLLDMRAGTPPALDNFIPGDNEELLAALTESVAGGGHLYLWGPSGSGRSHLLHAAVAAARLAGRPTAYFPAATISFSLPDSAGMVIAIDDIEQLSEDGQIAAFNAFNRAPARTQTLLLAGAQPPIKLALREDLRTRVGQTLVYEVRPLDDDARTEILKVLAERRGLRLGDEVIAFLLRHGRRDLPSLISVLDALDEASLERKRPVTLPLLREVIQAGLRI